MASQIGRTPEGLELFESGQLAPSSPILALMAHVLGVPFEDLVDDSVRAVDREVAAVLGAGPIVAPRRRGALITLLSAA